MPECGSQVVLCDLPVRLDTYKGCAHGCRYCFTQRKVDIGVVSSGETYRALEAFIEGRRTKTTAWCDWDIPLHWGGLSDPFQPAEKKQRISLECLKVLARTKYPFVVSTKGALVAAPEYLDLLAECNAVVQISMVCDKYDRIEAGAPSFEERLVMLDRVSRRVKRTIVRLQPYMTEVQDDVLANLERFRAAGAYGVTVEGMKFIRKKEGLEKVGADFVYPLRLLRGHFGRIKEEAHRVGLHFYCAENRLRALGDSMTCCGVDGLEGFRPNTFNLCHMINGLQVEGSEKMKQVGTATCFQAIYQKAGSTQYLRKHSFQSMMLHEYKEKRPVYAGVFGKNL